MSVTDTGQSAPIAKASPLGLTLSEFAAPPLSSGFADRLVAAADIRPAPLSSLRRPARGRGWRTGRRMAIGAACLGVFASAAAATGLLQQLAFPLPSPGTVWASITGTAAPAPARNAPPAPAPIAASAQVAAGSLVDTPEELRDAFRRADQLRTDRRAARRVLIDQRVRAEIERRRAAGLPVPSADAEARLRARIEAAVVRREQRADAAITARRETMQRKVENGEAMTRDDLIGDSAAGPVLRESLRELRQLPPEQRRAAWRDLPPEERRALIDEARAWRAGRPPLPSPPAANADTAPVPVPDTEGLPGQ